MNTKVRKKLFQLFTGELAATISFAFLWLLYLQMFESVYSYLTSFSTLFAFGLLEFISCQGSYYWFLKWRQVINKNYLNLPNKQLRLFTAFKRINLAFIAVGVIILIYEFMSVSVVFNWFLFLFLFAIIEHVNYYHIRLSYLSIDELRDFFRQKKLRRSKLANELKQIQKSSS